MEATMAAELHARPAINLFNVYGDPRANQDQHQAAIAQEIEPGNQAQPPNQVVQTGNPHFLEVQNAALLAIQAATVMQATVEGQAAHIQQLQQTVSQLSANVTQLTTTIQDLGTRVGGVSTSITETNTNVQNLEQRVGAVNDTVQNLNGRVQAAENNSQPRHPLSHRDFAGGGFHCVVETFEALGIFFMRLWRGRPNPPSH